MGSVILLTAVLLLVDGSVQTATWAKPSAEACGVDKIGLETAFKLDVEAGKIAGGVAWCYEEPIREVTGAPQE